MQPTSTENNNCRMWIEDGIVFSVVDANELSLEIAKSLVALRYKFTSGQEFPHIVDISKIKSVTKEARDYLSHGEAVSKIPACALISHSIISKLMANFFMAFNKPPIPIKMFSDKADAVKWVEKYKHQ